jgi:hypothetical protein
MMEIVKPKHDALTSNAERDGERVKHGDGEMGMGVTTSKRSK